MNKGINTIIQETKKEMADLVNEKLKLGLPISVIGLILDGICYEVANGIKSSLIEEKKQEPKGQVIWEDDTSGQPTSNE